MRPVHEFQENFSQVVKDTHANPVSDDLILHDADSTVRNLCLVWENGRRAFFNYAYLLSVDLVLTDYLNVMQLHFNGQAVTLKGFYLEPLFDLLLEHIPKKITVRDPRYRISEQTRNSLVIEIQIKNV